MGLKSAASAGSLQIAVRSVAGFVHRGTVEGDRRTERERQHGEGRARCGRVRASARSRRQPAAARCYRARCTFSTDTPLPAPWQTSHDS
jgi:hypothetical protein